MAAKNGCLQGLNFDLKEKLNDCEVCIESKSVQLPFPTGEKNESLEILEIVHSDVCGPMKVKSPGNARYFITFIDERTRYRKVYFLKNKNEAFSKFKEYRAEVEKFTNHKIKYLQSDNGTEFCNKEFDEYLKSNGIQRRLSVPYTP